MRAKALKRLKEKAALEQMLAELRSSAADSTLRDILDKKKAPIRRRRAGRRWARPTT